MTLEDIGEHLSHFVVGSLPYREDYTDRVAVCDEALTAIRKIRKNLLRIEKQIKAQKKSYGALINHAPTHWAPIS